MSRSKSKIKFLSWFDIVIGAVFFILTNLGIFIIFSLTEVPPPDIFGLSSSILIGLLMIISGYILIESKLKNSKIVGWLTSIFGFLNIILVFLNILYYQGYGFLEIIIGFILSEITFILMMISGYHLRKHI